MFAAFFSLFGNDIFWSFRLKISKAPVSLKVTSSESGFHYPVTSELIDFSWRDTLRKVSLQRTCFVTADNRGLYLQNLLSPAAVSPSVASFALVKQKNTSVELTSSKAWCCNCLHGKNNAGVRVGGFFVSFLALRRLSSMVGWYSSVEAPALCGVSVMIRGLWPDRQ